MEVKDTYDVIIVGGGAAGFMLHMKQATTVCQF